MDDDISQWGYYTQTLNLRPPVSDPVPSATPSRCSDKRTDTRKCAMWDPREHHIFVEVADQVTGEGHLRGKCFTSTGWERIGELFNGEAWKDWTIAQLKNQWGVMRMDHKLLFELLRSIGIQYDLSNGGRIEAANWWWEMKLKENLKYGKFKDHDNSEIYHSYSKLFGGSRDATKYTVSQSKMCQHGLELSSDSHAEDCNDMVPINAETTDSSDGPAEGRVHCP